MFCQKCGSKAIEGAEFCQKCGTRLIKSDTETTQSANMPTKSEPVAEKASEPFKGTASVTKVTPNECVTEEKPIKKKSKNTPLLIVVLVVLVLLLACIIVAGSSSSSLTESSEADTAGSYEAGTDLTVSEINLSQTFTDMGISFSYPDNWIILDDNSDLIIVSMIDENNNADHRVTFDITMTLDQNPLNVFSGDVATVRNAVNENLSFIEYKDIYLGDIPAKYLKYQSDGLKSPDINENYFYRIGNEGYWVHCTYTDSDKDIYSPLLEKIIASYTVTADTSLVQETSSASDDDLIRSAYAEKVRELAAEDSDLTFSLIDLTADDVLELVADKSGYYINIYAYDNGAVVPIIEEWGYGAGGNQGYEYLPGKNIIRNTSLEGAGREMYTTYMCVDSNHKVQYAYDTELCYIYPSSYYYGEREISEYDYSDYQIAGDFSMIEGIMVATQMTAQLSEGINIRSLTDDKITVKGVPVSSLIGVPINAITYWWGEPLEKNTEFENTYFRYDGFYLAFGRTGNIYNVIIDPEMCSVNGQTLNKNKGGIAEILGTPAYEGWSEDGYNVYYDYPSDGYSVHFYLTSEDGTTDAMRLESFY